MSRLFRHRRQGRTGTGVAVPVVRPRRPQGYTLLEMLVVAAVMALIAGLILPRFGRLPVGMQRRQTETAIAEAFRDAATRARASGVSVLLSVDAKQNRLHLGACRPAGANDGNGPEEAPPSPRTGMTAGRPQGGTAPRKAAPHAAVEFGPDMDYPLPNGVAWQPAPGHAAAVADAEAASSSSAAGNFIFHADGEAGGGPWEFAIGDVRYRLAVDRLTARPLLEEQR